MDQIVVVELASAQSPRARRCPGAQPRHTVAAAKTRGALAGLVALMWTAALAACPSSPASSGDGDAPDAGRGAGGGTGGTVQARCEADDACGVGEVCNLDTGSCRPGLDCTANPSACAFCGDAMVDCGFGVAEAYCSAAGVCRRAKPACAPCTDDAECAEAASGLPSRCADGFCATGCGACPPGFRCEAGGCVPIGGAAQCAGTVSCADDAEACPDGQTCTGLGVCLALCSSDVQCPAGQICSTEPGPSQQQCVAGCPLGARVIQDGVEKVCHTDGRYGVPCPTAGSGTGCPPGAECDADGVCQRAGCQSDAECPLARTICDLASATCVDGCNDDDDCGAFETCASGQCRPEGCRGKELSCNFGEWCCGAEAYADPAMCPATVVDGACFLAPDPWCRPCESNYDCADIEASPFSGGRPSLCFELTGNDASGQQQSLGKFCSVGCSSNADCPRGLDCVQDLPTEQEGVTTSGCIDSLCPSLAAAR